MAKHMEIIKDACERLWKTLEKLNESNPDPVRDGEQYHHVISAIYKAAGIKMIEEAEEEEEYSQRRGGGQRGFSGMYDPVWYASIRRGNSYGGGERDWDMEGMSGARNQRRDSMGRFSREGGNGGGNSYRNDGGGYSGHDNSQRLMSMLYQMRDNATSDHERMKYQNMIETMERG